MDDLRISWILFKCFKLTFTEILERSRMMFCFTEKRERYYAMNQQTQRARFHPAKMTFSRIQDFKKSCIQQALRQHSVAYSTFGFLFKLLRNFNNFPMLRAYSRRSPTFLMSGNFSYTRDMHQVYLSIYPGMMFFHQFTCSTYTFTNIQNPKC